MAARLWAMVLAARLLAAGTLALWAATAFAAPWAGLVAGVVVWMGATVALVAVSLALAHQGERVRWRRAAPMRLLRILCREAIEAEVMLIRMAGEPLLTWLDRGAGRRSALPARVVLVHGIACNRAVWRPLLAALRAAGIERVDAVNLEPLLADIEALARDLLERIEGLGACRPVVIVAHSMGGLVARAAARIAAPGTIERIITLGTPHQGTEMACRFGWASTRQMCPGSPWLLELNGQREGRPGVPLTSLYSLDDNLIVPAVSAAIRGARLIELRGLGHLSLLSARSVLATIASELCP